MAISDPDDKKQKTDHGHGHSHSHEPGEEHAKIVGLGTVTVGGATFTIDRDGQVEAGKTTEFGVELVSGKGVPSAAWLANPDGEKVCEPVTAEAHDSHWHFNVEPLDPVKKAKFILQVGGEEAAVDFARGAAPVNDGILSVLKAPATPEWRGFLELKLHGDAGDLELFLYEGFAVSNWKVQGKPKPLDVPASTVLKLTFPDGPHAGKQIDLAVRNNEQNEDEDGTPNMRATGTNYFIFPGESGQDPAFLVGETVTSWRGLVSVAFEVNGKAYAADPFVLVPHDAL